MTISLSNLSTKDLTLGMGPQHPTTRGVQSLKVLLVTGVNNNVRVLLLWVPRMGMDMKHASPLSNVQGLSGRL